MSDQFLADELRTLIARAQQGEREAFNELYARIFTPLYRYVFFRVRRKEDAEDITQQVFLKAYEALDRFEERGVTPLAYFYSIARNAVIDHWRKKGEMLFADVPDTIGDRADSSEGAARILERLWAAEAVSLGLSCLTPLEAEAITLRFLHDMPNAEIATLLGRTEEAVRQLQSRGIRKMRSRTTPL